MNNIVQVLLRWAESLPGAIAISTEGAQATVSELAARAGGIAAMADRLPSTIALLTSNSIDWMAAEVGLWAAGANVVPLPAFFSNEQLDHILRDAGADAVLVSPDQEPRIRNLGAEPVLLDAPPEVLKGIRPEGRRIIYTSGSTGRPKGVILDLPRIMHTSRALAAAIGASSEDLHLSVLPQSMLLESICGIYVPLLARARVHVVSDLFGAPPKEIPQRLASAAAAVRPTTSVLVPELLAAWIEAAAVGIEVPDSLRVVAVGGALVPEGLSEQAWALGIPAYEGYGLSECGSVVAANVPHDRRAGTVGRPLSGFDVSIAEDGEIVVRSPAVMEGYLNRKGSAEVGVWSTGDVGMMDNDGYLVVRGRKDNLIVLSNGRNISPEWVEAMLAIPPVVRAVVLADGQGHLAAMIETTAPVGRDMSPSDAAGFVDRACASAPFYAKPTKVLALPAGTLAAEGLLTPNGKVRRAVARDWYLSNMENAHENLRKRAVV